MTVLSSDEIMATYVAPSRDYAERVLSFLTRKGPSTTREMSRVGGLSHGGEAGTLKRTLADLVEQGKVIATTKEPTEKGGRPGIVWKLA